MQILIDIPKHHYENIKSIDSVSLGRIPYKGIIMYSINAIKNGVVQEHRKGHWIESDYGNMITQHRWYCSECGGVHNDPESGEWREVFDFKYDYCPLCGADMREVEE